MSATQQYEYDLVVIGSGPAGQRAAIQATKLGKKTALVERRAVVGGVCINTGTIPSKTLREAVLHLSGYRERAVYGKSYTVKQKITMEDLLFRADYVIRHEVDVTRHQLQRNNVELVTGSGSFTDPHTILAENELEGSRRTLTAANVLIATGTASTRDGHIPFDGKSILTSDDILSLDRLPRTLAVVGGGVIGCEYASMFATLGVRVTLIDKRPDLLGFVDKEIGDTLVYHLRENRVTLRLEEEVAGVDVAHGESGDHVRILLASGKQVVAEKVLYSVGRTGATATLGLDRAGLTADDRGRIRVDSHYRTCVSHIFAAGDVIGFPSLASTSMEQGRLSACHAFNHPTNSTPELFPYGIYTIPEISMVGKTERDLTTEGVPYEIGKARYSEIARGQILGDQTGLVKLIFHLETRELLGIHIIGDGASELVHIGQAVLAHGGELDYFVNTVFNYPTLAEGYKIAAFDGINRLGVNIL
ncbi:MAG: Si-specific NAD(P)(+) transhydrogenase [Bryobacteraceae bacterium]